MGIESKIAAGVGGVTGIAQSALANYNMVQDPRQMVSMINSTRMQPQTTDDSYSALLGDYNNMVHFNDIDRGDLGYNSGKGVMNVFSSAGSGAAAGASIASWPGAIIGGIAGAIGGLFGLDSAKKKADKGVNLVNNTIHEVEDYNEEALRNRASNLQEDESLNLFRNTFKSAAYGGPLEMHKGALTPFGNRFNIGGGLHTQGSDWTNGIVAINEGATHEANPYDGVQMGIDPQGVPNLVEEGEVVYKDYVFSNRLKVPEAVRQKYKLRDTKELTFADAAKQVQKESEERPNDPISKRGLEDWMAKLANEQEDVRMKKAKRQLIRQAKALGITPEELLAQQMQQQQMQQQLPMDANGIAPMVSAYGGSIHIKPSKKGTFTAAASKHGMGVQEFASKVLANKDDYSPAMVKKANFAKNAAGWKHGLGGNLFLYGSNMIAGPEEYNERPPYEIFYDWFSPNYNISSIIPPEEGTQYRTSDFWKSIPNDKTVWTPGYGNVTAGKFANSIKADTNQLLRTTPLKQPVDPENTTKPGYDWLTGLRYVPAVGAALGVFSDLMGWTNKPDYSNADMIMRAANSTPTVKYRPIGDYMRYTPFDRMFYLNQLNANAAANRRALMNTSGGNRGTAMAGLLASDYNTLNSIGSLARQAEEYNLGQREKVKTFNRATNMANAENDLKAQIANQQRSSLLVSAAQAAAQMRDAVDARVSAGRSANLTNLFDSIGNIGWEEFNRNMVNTSNPYYNIGRDGKLYWTARGLALPKEERKRLLEESDRYGEIAAIKNDPLTQMYTTRKNR